MSKVSDPPAEEKKADEETIAVGSQGMQGGEEAAQAAEVGRVSSTSKGVAPSNGADVSSSAAEESGAAQHETKKHAAQSQSSGQIANGRRGSLQKKSVDVANYVASNTLW